MNDEHDAIAFLNGTFKAVCNSEGLESESDPNSTVQTFARQDGLRMMVSAASLGSVLSVTCMLEGADVLRTMNLKPEEIRSKEFLRTHLVAWTLNGGTYDASHAPHFQGLATPILGRLAAFLDPTSRRNMSQTSKGIRTAVISAPQPSMKMSESSPATQRSGARSAFYRMQWSQMDVA